MQQFKEKRDIFSGEEDHMIMISHYTPLLLMLTPSNIKN